MGGREEKQEITSIQGRERNFEMEGEVAAVAAALGSKNGESNYDTSRPGRLR